ncbi:aldehyde dehydrogenase family protein [Fodinicurvata sp. EGI_FJ10296]|uniref:L-piperidine-6-carboxylate dehydrogenase n=1 Tax=Fodinicurvata sp. EGI_FJ10296 TaxID=3231908 RepID=UPI0034526C92
MGIERILTSLGVDVATRRAAPGSAAPVTVRSPIDGSELATLAGQTTADCDRAIANAVTAFSSWRAVPAPRRGELVRLLGQELRDHKEELGTLVTYENGKIYQEGLGEVQEMIDICDFAVGLSRQLYGLTIASERPGHSMRETWHPLGPIGIITAFNFPVAVWSWNTAIALVCGDPVVWKPSEKTPLTALACEALLRRAMMRLGGDAPDGLLSVLIGGADLGERLADSPALPLISATGSTRMGRAVAPRVAGRLGRTVLELGGNNAMIVTPSADIDMAVRGIVFGAVGTAGQRCTSLRRLIVHDDVYDVLLPKLIAAYRSIRIGDPRMAETLVGPLIDQSAADAMDKALQQAAAEGGVVHGGGPADDVPAGGVYRRPALVEMPEQNALVRDETFAPILYVLRYRDWETALHLQNDVPQGLSSCVFTTDVREAESFLSPTGSDTGLANVNIGPSGAEIGGAFGGEKDTGGGRESGSDAWKAYMRRQTATINYSRELPLAQGVRFDF